MKFVHQAEDTSKLSPTEMRIKILKEKYGIDFSDLPQGYSKIVTYWSDSVICLGGQTFPIKETPFNSHLRFILVNVEELCPFKIQLSILI